MIAPSCMRYQNGTRAICRLSLTAASLQQIFKLKLPIHTLIKWLCIANNSPFPEDLEEAVNLWA